MIAWLISYPRSGNTFTRILVEKVFQLENSYTVHYQDTTDRALVDVFGKEYLKNDKYLELARNSKHIYFVKTHDLPDNKIDLEKDKFLYIIRDGRSSIASYHHFLKDFSKQKKTVQEIILGKVAYGSWSQHVSEWIKNFNDNNSIVLKYEDIISNPMKIATSIGNFVGLNVHKVDIPTFKQLHEQRPQFFRSGNNEKWRQEFSEIDLIHFWLLNFDIMKKYGYSPEITEQINFDKNVNSTSKIISSLSELSKIPFKYSPIKKYIKYKELLKYYQEHERMCNE